MVCPEVLFATTWRRRKYKATGFKFLDRSNVVHHMSFVLPPYARSLRSALYRSHPPSVLRTCAPLAAANLEKTTGAFAHLRIRTQKNGKFLIFGTGNVILAGRRTHASACVSSMRMALTLSTHCAKSSNLWPAVHEAPNSVVTGQLIHRVDDAIKQDSVRVNHSPKFPGIALSVKQNGITPELYLRRCMIIIPGVTRAKQLSDAVACIADIVAPFTTSICTET